MSDGSHTNILRTFLGWDTPVLVLAAQALLNRASRTELDLSNFLVVTPGSRAARILNTILATEAPRAGVLYTPPKFLTPGRLVASLYECSQQETPEMYSRLAWIESLRRLPLASLSPLIPNPPKPEQANLWARYADLFARTCTQLAGENIRPSEVPDLARKRREHLIVDIDSGRWSALQEALDGVESLLASVDLTLSSSQQLALTRAAAPTRSAAIVLVAVSELAGLARSALSKYPGPIESLIGAPESVSNSFDRFGCVIPERWPCATSIPDEHVLFVDSPAAQAEAVFSSLAHMSPPPAPQDIVIAVPDRDIAPHLESISRELDGVRIRDAAAASLESTPTGVLLELISSYCEDRSFRGYVRLLRHPHFERALAKVIARQVGTADYFAALDTFGSMQAPSVIDATWACADPKLRRILTDIFRGVNQLLEPVIAGNELMPPAHWARAIRELLERVYRDRRIKTSTSAGRRTLAGIQAIATSLNTLESVPLELLPTPIRIVDAIGYILNDLRNQQIAPDPVSDSIEALGWLDAALDPAPIAILTGINEGVVPEKVSSDPLLPESVAEALNISCNSSRLGRDAYLLSTIHQSRRTPGSAAIVIAGRRTNDGDPLWPSRLLFPESSVLSRVQRLLENPSIIAPVQRAHQPSGVNGFFVRPLDDLTPPLHLSVSAFKQYLRSPYEFYLDRVLRLEEFADAGEELDPRSFGSLIHAALKLFGDSPARHLTNEADLVNALQESLDTHIASAFGKQTRPEVQIQVQLAKRRIQQLAHIEARRRADGWTIEHCEWNKGTAKFESNGATVEVRGTIDRIDHHAATDTWEIIDYKTSNSATSPDSTHYAPRSDSWKDLQLPLYRHLAAGVTGGKVPTLSYLVLPRDPRETAILPMTRKVDLSKADLEIRRVINEILASRFRDAGNSDATEGSRGALLGIGLVDVDGVPPRIKGESEE